MEELDLYPDFLGNVSPYQRLLNLSIHTYKANKPELWLPELLHIQ